MKLLIASIVLGMAVTAAPAGTATAYCIGYGSYCGACWHGHG